MNPIRLGDGVRLDVVYEDKTPLGSMLSGRCEQLIQERCAFVAAFRRKHGLAATVASSERLLTEALRAGALGDWYDGAGRLREEHLYPSPSATRPVALAVETAGAVRTARIPAGVACDLARWIGDWQRGVPTPPRSGHARDLWDALDALGALTSQPRRPRAPGEALFVGHATARLGSAGESVVFDPFVLPTDPSHPGGYQPLTVDEIGADAVFVTHSHPDHFDLGSLLRFGATTPIFVPHVGRESILSVDMAARLAELGFENVQTVAPFREVTVGRTRVVALPFHGEQPTRDETLHPGVRNVGNTYWVESAGRTYALVADSGADGQGSVHDIASMARGRYGAPDVVFGGYRAWAMYPLRYLFSSVARYLLFVPRSRWLVRQKIMNDADDLLDLAELWHARCVVPYADGGAPWYWRRGLGPRLDGDHADNPHVDPLPDRVAEAARNRSMSSEGAVPSQVGVTVLRPGEALSSSFQPERSPDHRWPFAEACA